MVGGFFLAVLDRNLHVIEAGCGELIQRLRRNPDSRGDEICVKPGGMCCSGDLDKVTPRARLAAGEMHLQHAECRSFIEYPRPCRRIKLAPARIERQRVGAIRTAERTAVRQLSEETEWFIQILARGGDHT